MKPYNVDIADLPLSSELKDACARHGIVTLNELLEIPVDDFTTMLWLNASMLEELKQLIEKHKQKIGSDGDGRFI